MKTIIKILLSLILILSISKTKAQMSKWVIGASQWNSSGILNSYQAGNLKFYDVDYSGSNPIVSARVLGNSITSKKSYGVANVINSITNQNGQIAFYLFMNSPYPINNQTINTDDTLFIVMPNNITGQDDIIGFAGSFTCGRTIQETGICQVPGTTDQYYVILKTSCTSAYLDNIEYVIVNTTSKTISQSYVIVSNKHTNEVIAISKLS